MQPAAVWLTSNAVLGLWLKEIKGGCCSIWHREVLAKSVRMWWSHSAHFPVKGSLDMSTLSPDQGWNVPERGSNLIAYPCCVNEPWKQISTPITNLPLTTKYSNKYDIVFAMTELAALILQPSQEERLIRSQSWEISTDSSSSTNPDIPLYWSVYTTKASHQIHRGPVPQRDWDSVLLSQQNWPPEPVKSCKSVLIETLKPAGLSHMNSCKRLTVQASGRNNRIHSKF